MGRMLLKLKYFNIFIIIIIIYWRCCSFYYYLMHTSIVYSLFYISRQRQHHWNITCMANWKSSGGHPLNVLKPCLCAVSYTLRNVLISIQYNFSFSSLIFPVLYGVVTKSGYPVEFVVFSKYIRVWSGPNHPPVKETIELPEQKINKTMRPRSPNLFYLMLPFQE